MQLTPRTTCGEAQKLPSHAVDRWSHSGAAAFGHQGTDELRNVPCDQEIPAQLHYVEHTRGLSNKSLLHQCATAQKQSWPFCRRDQSLCQKPPGSSSPLFMGITGCPGRSRRPAASSAATTASLALRLGGLKSSVGASAVAADRARQRCGRNR